MSLIPRVLRSSPGALFRRLVSETRSPKSSHSIPFPILGTPNAYTALLAQHSGVRAVYLSGSSLSTVSLGLPDLSFLQSSDVALEASRITSACPLPLLCDIDTGLSSSSLGIRRTVQQVEAAGAAGVHIEDQQINVKRCGHRPNKTVVSAEEMVERIRAAVDGRSDPHFVVMARTDALATEGLEGVMKRVELYVNAGADMIFLEAATELKQYEEVGKLGVPILANMTEFGGPAWSREELGRVGVSMALYPVSVQRAMAKSAMMLMEGVMREGRVSEKAVAAMQTREAMYEIIRYHEYEKMQEEMAKQR